MSRTPAAVAFLLAAGGLLARAQDERTPAPKAGELRIVFPGGMAMPATGVGMGTSPDAAIGLYKDYKSADAAWLDKCDGKSLTFVRAGTRVAVTGSARQACVPVIVLDGAEVGRTGWLPVRMLWLPTSPGTGIDDVEMCRKVFTTYSRVLSESLRDAAPPGPVPPEQRRKFELAAQERFQKSLGQAVKETGVADTDTAKQLIKTALAAAWRPNFADR